jgi:hypothetical protein
MYGQPTIMDEVDQIESELLQCGLQYHIMLDIEDAPLWFSDAFLPGFFPARDVALCWDRAVDSELGLCKHDCQMACHCHVCIPVVNGNNRYRCDRKFCIVMFHDLMKPKWKLEDVN